MLRARVFFYCLCIVLKLSHLHTYLVFNFFWVYFNSRLFRKRIKLNCDIQLISPNKKQIKIFIIRDDILTSIFNITEKESGQLDEWSN